MKKLKKILLINWLYFDRELIEVGDVNFLTGRNGAGKSTVIDALQIVLLGDQRAELQSRRERALAAHAGRLSARRHGREQSALAPRKGFFELYRLRVL